ncbi:hypothetical protein [Kitasatospora aureofaciens]|uniref:hypothetical protein n=1 Tax=Kitasatospora aureofaciens TaxID=1894 RepID=UPI003822B667
MTDSSIENPTPWSDFDWMEFEGFVCKVDREGFGYAYNEYRPRFESASLQAVAADRSSMHALYKANLPLVEGWWETVGPERACALHNAHVDEERRREDDACLWGFR